MGKGKKPPQMKLILSDLLIDSKTGTTKVGKVEFDPDNVEAELEALGKHLPGISQSGDVGEESNLLSGVILTSEGPTPTLIVALTVLPAVSITLIVLSGFMMEP